MALIPPQPVGAVGASILIGLVTYFVVTYYLNYRKCSEIKGPWLASFSGLWLLRSTVKGRMHLDCMAAHDKYGPIVRIAPGKVAVNDPAIWRHMSSARSNFKRGTWYDALTLNPVVRNSLSERDDKRHNELRSKLIRGYSGKELPELEDNITDRVMDWINLIRNESAKGKLVDVATLAGYFTMDVLTQIAFEKPVGYLTRNEDVFDYLTQASIFLMPLEVASNFPTVQNVMSSKAMASFQPKTTDKVGIGAMLGVAEEVVNRRYRPGAEVKNDMLGSFIKNGLSKEEAFEESMLQLLGGSDSTATAIRMIFLYIITNPRVYNKLMKEFEDNASKLTKPVMTSAEARTLPYFQACIKEGLRIHPPLTGLQGKVSPPGGETVNGHFLPGGIEICWTPFSMQRRKDIYGDDANVFRPERWIEATQRTDGSEKLGQMDRAVELVFGSGRFSCLGKMVAMIEIEKSVSALLLYFDWTVASALTPVRTITTNGAHVQADMWCQASERVVKV